MSNGCYADGGPLRLHWDKVSKGKRGVNFSDFTQAIEVLPHKQLWRHNQAGDLVGTNGKIHKPALRKLVKANRGKRGYTYTHYPVLGDSKKAQHNREAIKEANESGFTVNLSANSAKEAFEMSDLGIAPVTVVLPETVAGRIKLKYSSGKDVLVCPATRKEDVSCASCKLCAAPDREVIIGFPAHGSGKRKFTAELIL